MTPHCVSLDRLRWLPPRELPIGYDGLCLVAKVDDSDRTGHHVYDPAGAAPTIRTDDGDGPGLATGLYWFDGTCRRLSFREAARTQSIPETAINEIESFVTTAISPTKTHQHSREGHSKIEANWGEFQAGKSNKSRQIALELARSGVIIYVICGPDLFDSRDWRDPRPPSDDFPSRSPRQPFWPSLLHCQAGRRKKTEPCVPSAAARPSVHSSPRTTDSEHRVAPGTD